MTSPQWSQPPVGDAYGQDPAPAPSAVPLAPYQPVDPAPPPEADSVGERFMDNYHESLTKTPLRSLAGAGIAILLGVVTLMSAIGDLMGNSGLIRGGTGANIVGLLIGLGLTLIGVVGMLALFRGR